MRIFVFHFFFAEALHRHPAIKVQPDRATVSLDQELAKGEAGIGVGRYPVHTIYPGGGGAIVEPGEKDFDKIVAAHDEATLAATLEAADVAFAGLT